MSLGKAKRRILAALWRSPVLQILQTENLKRKNTRIFRVFSIHKSLYINELKQKWWPDPESNWGHGDFQSPALPTELSCHLMLLNKHPFSFFSSSILKKFRFFHQETAFHLLPRREFFNASPREGHATSVPGPGPYRNHAPHGRANSRKPAPHHNDVSRQPASRSPPPRRREPRQIE